MKTSHFNRRRVTLIAAIVCTSAAGLTASSAAAQRGQQRSESSPAEAELQKGIGLTRDGKFQEAIPHFLAARGKVADDFALSFNLALCYFGVGRHPQAIELLNELRSRGRVTADVENLLALSLLARAKPDEAYAAFERAARLAPKNEKLYLYMAEACMDNGYYDLGLKAVAAGLEKMPRSARLVFERGLLLVKLDHLDEAKKDLQRVSELAPGSDVAYMAAAQKNLFDGNVAEARRIAREGIDKGQHHFMLLALYGEAALRAGVEPGQPEFTDVRDALEGAVAQRPNYISARITLGKVYLAENRWDDAIAQLSAARELDAQNTAVYSNLASAYRRKGATEQAEEMLRILAQLNAQEVERIRSAPGDRKAGYAERTRPPDKPPPQH